jgi:hypothetical protein
VCAAQTASCTCLCAVSRAASTQLSPCKTRLTVGVPSAECPTTMSAPIMGVSDPV